MISKRPNLMAIPPRQLKDTHTQLAAMFDAEPSDVREFVTLQQGILERPFEPAKYAGMVELWCNLTGQPPHVLLEMPELLDPFGPQRCVMRLCFLRHHGRNPWPPYEELRTTYKYEFC